MFELYLKSQFISPLGGGTGNYHLILTQVINHLSTEEFNLNNFRAFFTSYE